MPLQSIAQCSAVMVCRRTRIGTVNNARTCFGNSRTRTERTPNGGTRWSTSADAPKRFEMKRTLTTSHRIAIAHSGTTKPLRERIAPSGDGSSRRRCIRQRSGRRTTGPTGADFRTRVALRRSDPAACPGFASPASPQCDKRSTDPADLRTPIPPGFPREHAALLAPWGFRCRLAASPHRNGSHGSAAHFPSRQHCTPNTDHVETGSQKPPKSPA